MIQFEHVDFTYEANSETPSLRDISFTVKTGECVLLAGASGCGKSTLLRLLNGLIPEFYPGERKGRVLIEGREISNQEIYDLVGRIGTVFQNPRAQFFNVDTTSELVFGCENLALPEEEIVKRLEKTVADFHMEKLMNRSIFELSGGEKQRIACASVATLHPEIILLDEPSANLDFEGTENLRQMLAAWKELGKTILIAEHRISYVWDIVDRVLYLEEGRLRADWHKEELVNFTEETCQKYGLRSLVRSSPMMFVTPEGYRLEQNTAVTKAVKEQADQIVLRDFSYTYRHGATFRVRELRLPRYKVTAIVGANGTGKTTFLECLSGIRKNKGKLYLAEGENAGQDAAENGLGRAYSGRRCQKLIFMVMQDPNHQLFTESVLDEVLVSMPEEDEDKARVILEEVDLAQYADRHPMSLSGGQKQRVAIACAIASKRPILLLDEPTSGLDRKHMLEVAELLKRLKEQGRTIITVTHDSEFIRICCDEVMELSEVSA
ncbi:MAG: ABC transporter ATP-binding protein [Lachnospiraceae bacterium]|nr:ABC transporter ATP-binding protein [Lachnospiraceae bacterium]